MHNECLCLTKYVKASTALVFTHIAVSPQSCFVLNNRRNDPFRLLNLLCLWALDDQCFTGYIPPPIYSGLYSLAIPCIYRMCKNCRAVCIYNNTACSHSAWLSPLGLDVACHRFICRPVIGPCFSAPFFFPEVSLPLQIWGFVMMEQTGYMLLVCVGVCLCVRVQSLPRVLDWGVIIMTGLCACFSL